MSILNRVARAACPGSGGHLALCRRAVSGCAVGRPASGRRADGRPYAAGLHARPSGSGRCGARSRHTTGAGTRLDVDEDQIALTTGSSGAFLLSFLAAFDHGDRVALTRPGYPAYRNILASLGCEVVELACGPAERFQPSVEMLEQAHAAAPLAGLVVASPANPTGTMIAPDHLAELAAWCRDHEVRLVSDEIYHGITDRTVAASCAWEHDREAIVISSFSKYWGMTGWRLGWSLVPADLVTAFDALAGNFTLCPPVPAQHAAIAAFTDESYREADAAVAAFADARAICAGRHR